MRIPPSVVVMSLVTAAPFALAIRDTLNNKHAVRGDELGDYDARYDRENSRALAEYEAEMRREAEEREARSKERVAQLDQLYGVQKAAMGPLLEGIELGAGAGSFQPEHVRRRIENASREGFINVYFDADATALNAVNITVNSDGETADACEQLTAKLEASWGAGTNNVWIDPARHQRAAFDEERCTLRFDRYIEPTDWVAALPLAAIGANAEKFADTLGGSAEVDDERIYWSMPGLRFGKQDTKLEAYVVNHKIVGFKATVDSDFDSTVAVRDALATKLKSQPNKDDYDNVWAWKRRVPVTLDQFATDRFSVLVGKMPWD